tara:strand:- start:774 stop:1031 length:258 start_codon:yes stop_codon:yes gene_type:complete
MAKEATQMISEEELKSIQGLTQKQNEVILSLGSVEVQKINLKEMFKANSQALEDIKKELEKEYGTVQIDLKTGEISEMPKEDDKK